MRFANTCEGARAAFLEVVGRAVPDGASIERDPAMAGVWAIRGAFPDYPDRPDAIVYVEGYADPFGRIRKESDVEGGRLK